MTFPAIACTTNGPSHYSKVVFTVRTNSGTASDVFLQVAVDRTKFEFLTQYPSDFSYVGSVGVIDYYRTAPSTYGFDFTLFYEIPVAVKQSVNNQTQLLKYSLRNASNCQIIETKQLRFLPQNLVVPSGQSITLSSILSQTNPSLLPSAQAALEKQSLTVLGTLIIDQNYTFGRDTDTRDGTEIHMGAGAKIKVNFNRTLELKGTELYGCGNLWDRIECEHGSSLIASNAYFEDAQYAIHLNIGDFNELLGDISLINCEFTDNIYGMYTPVHTLPTNNTINKIDFIIRDFHSNWFIGNDEMMNSFSGMTETTNQLKAGIHAYNWPELHTFGFGQENYDYGPVAKPNLFRDLPSGIIAHNCVMYLNTCIFENFSHHGVIMTQSSHAELRLSLNNPTNATSCRFINPSVQGAAIESEARICIIDDAFIQNARYGITVTSQSNAFIEIINNEIEGFSSWGARLINDQGVLKSSTTTLCHLTRQWS